MWGVILFLLPLIAYAREIVIEPEFQPYVKSFKAAYRAATGKTIHTDNLSIYKDELYNVVNRSNPNAVAECSASDDPIIVVRALRGWGAYSDTQREQLLFHELGHCILHLEHSWGIMAPEMMPDKKYISRRGYYLREFFEFGDKFLTWYKNRAKKSMLGSFAFEVEDE